MRASEWLCSGRTADTACSQFLTLRDGVVTVFGGSQFGGENVKYSKPDAGSSNSGYKSAAAGVAAGQHQTPGNAAAGLEQILYAVADSTQVLL